MRSITTYNLPAIVRNVSSYSWVMARHQVVLVWRRLNTFGRVLVRVGSEVIRTVGVVLALVLFTLGALLCDLALKLLPDGYRGEVRRLMEEKPGDFPF